MLASRLRLRLWLRECGPARPWTASCGVGWSHVVFFFLVFLLGVIGDVLIVIAWWLGKKATG